MSLADEVLANHTKDEPDPNWPNFPERCAKDWDLWPCAAVRLATQLRAAEQVVEAARNAEQWASCVNCGAMGWQHHPRSRCTGFESRVAPALAEYDKGGRE